MGVVLLMGDPIAIFTAWGEEGGGAFESGLSFVTIGGLLTTKISFLNSTTGAYSGPGLWACVLC